MGLASAASPREKPCTDSLLTARATAWHKNHSENIRKAPDCVFGAYPQRSGLLVPDCHGFEAMAPSGFDLLPDAIL